MKRRMIFDRDSLGWRLIAAVILGELVFSLVLAVTIASYSVRSAAEQRQESLRQISGVVAAALMPMIADQQEPQVRAQMQSIMEAADVREVVSIRIVDSAGGEVAVGEPFVGQKQTRSESLMDLLTSPQVLEQPVVISGLEVARVYVQFAPVGTAAALREPLLAAAIVVLAVVLVSVPWTAWLFVRSVVEPLDDLTRVAAEIAEGNLDVELQHDRSDEIGHLQDSLQQMAEQLNDRQQEVLRSYEELSCAHEELARMDALKSDFVAVASHELRTPLSTITLYSDMLSSGEICPLDEAGLDAVTSIGSSATRLNSIVSDLMDSALLERGMMRLEFGDVWVDELLANSIADVDARAREDGTRVAMEGTPPDSVVFGDAVRLRQVVDNLLSNAVKYSDGATLVSVTADDDDGWLTIQVIDRGRGIAHGEDERLFTLFGRLNSEDNRDSAGLGLGLAISARIVEAHCGTIAHSPNPEGHGSIFTVRIPLNCSVLREQALSLVKVVGEERTHGCWAQQCGRCPAYPCGR